MLVGIEINGPRVLFSPRARKLVILLNHGISPVENGNSEILVPFGQVNINSDELFISIEHRLV